MARFIPAPPENAQRSTRGEKSHKSTALTDRLLSVVQSLQAQSRHGSSVLIPRIKETNQGSSQTGVTKVCFEQTTTSASFSNPV